MTQLSLKGFENKVTYEQQYFTFSKHKSQAASKICAKAKREGTTYITRKRKSFAPGRPKKYEDIILFVKDLVEMRWNNGNPLSKTTLYECIVGKYCNIDCAFNDNILKSRNYPNSLHKFAERTLKSISFTTRRSSIAQKVPDNWKEVALVGAERV